MLAKGCHTKSRRSRLNVIAAPRETLVTNVGTFIIPCRLLKSFPKLAFRMAIRSLGVTRRVGHATAPLPRIAPLAFRLELFASFDYFNNLCWTSLDLRRERRAR